MRIRRIATMTALTCALSTALAATPATAAPPAPMSDAFYTAPARLDLSRPGAILNTRTRPAPALVVAGVEQLQFTSTDSHDRAIAAVTTVLTPPNHQPGAPTIVYAHAINSLGLQCAPSNAMWDDRPNVAMRESVLLNGFLAMGWRVVLPDHLGPQSAYGAADLGGRILLDAARATRNHTPNDTGAILMAGYSGGAMATAFAAAMAPTYAPELPLAAVAIGGTPVDIELMSEAIGHNRHPAFGIAAAVAAGLEREYGTDLPISEALSPAGRAFWNSIANACVNDILAAGAGHSVDDFGDSFEIYFQQKTRDILRANSIRYFDKAPAVPVFEWHSRTDPLIPVPELDATMAAWRERGTPVTQYPVDAPEHLSAAVVGMPAAVAFLADHATTSH